MSLRLLVATSLLALPAAAEVTITPVGERLNLRAVAAPLSEVLDQLARTTGMKVIYEGAVPRLPVTLTLEERTPVQAVLAVMEGQGLNFGLRSDAAGQRVDRLVIAGQAASSGGATPSAPVPTHGVAAAGPPPEGRDASEGLPGFDEEEGDPTADVPPSITHPPPRGTPPPEAQAPPLPSGPVYPSSPFANQPQQQVAPQAPPPPPPDPDQEKDE